MKRLLGLIVIPILVLLIGCSQPGYTPDKPSTITSTSSTNPKPSTLNVTYGKIGCYTTAEGYYSLGIPIPNHYSDSYYLIALIKPGPSTTANQAYIADLYEKGTLRDSTEVRWTQPQINVNDGSWVFYSATAQEYEAYSTFRYQRDLSSIFSIKVTVPKVIVPVVKEPSGIYTETIKGLKNTLTFSGNSLTISNEFSSMIKPNNTNSPFDTAGKRILKYSYTNYRTDSDVSTPIAIQLSDAATGFTYSTSFSYMPDNEQITIPGHIYLK